MFRNEGNTKSIGVKKIDAKFRTFFTRMKIREGVRELSERYF